jgi:hypothetical protein
MSTVDDDLEPCRFCGNDQFWFAPEFSFEHSVRRRVRQMEGSALVCRQCGHVETFIAEPDTWASDMKLGADNIVIAGAVWDDGQEGDDDSDSSDDNVGDAEGGSAGV